MRDCLLACLLAHSQTCFLAACLVCLRIMNARSINRFTDCLMPCFCISFCFQTLFERSGPRSLCNPAIGDRMVRRSIMALGSFSATQRSAIERTALRLVLFCSACMPMYLLLYLWGFLYASLSASLCDSSLVLILPACLN